AFTSSDNAWHESYKQYVINPGWNKNVTLKFDEAAWKRTLSGAETGPLPLQSKDIMQKMFLVFFGGYEGAVYVDNIRWGGNSGMSFIDAESEQDINLEITPFEALEARVTLRGAYYHEQNTDLAVSSAHLVLRGFGNELTLFSGENVKVFDDVFGLVDARATGNNILGFSLGGTVFPINTSYLLTGLSLDSDSPWKLGTSFIGAARLKTYVLDGNYIGAIYMNDRRGYYEGGNLFTGSLEQSTHVFGGDTSFAFPVLDIVRLGLKGEVLMTHYETLSPVFALIGPPFQYTPQTLTEDGGKMMAYAEASARAGFLTVYGYYRHIDNEFAAHYCNPDIKAGFQNRLIKASYIVDDLPPFSIIKSWSPDWASFVRNTQIMAEYDTGWSTTDDYSRQTYTLDIKNDESLAYYNYHIWYRNNTEGNARKTVSNKISGFTKILLFDILTFRLLGRVDNTGGTVLNDSVYEYKNYTQLTGFVEASLKLTRDLTLTASYKALFNEFASHSNLYAKLEANFLGLMSAALSYGKPALTGYWLDDDSNDTSDMYMITFKGRF
ncbi:MAG TPA: hypothetical protein P5511_02435, partial [Candidatus Goldiibacteriota bacterium]|nr:hypothetical protein [Candidatus Goldiibacteriota bacterium]